jgi:protease-4
VQSSIIHDEIVKLKTKYKKKVIVVGEDTLASGAYFIAVSADKIYVNPNTITGSIGVIMRGFGLTDAMKKLGVDRRVIASGPSKNRLDPFSPETPEDIAKMHTVLSEVLKNFTQVVIDGRKGKLHGDPKELFSGDFWTGQAALQLGLVDGLGDLYDVMQSEFHVQRYKEYSQTGNVFKGLLGQVGASLNLPLGSESVGVLEKV